MEVATREYGKGNVSSKKVLSGPVKANGHGRWAEVRVHPASPHPGIVAVPDQTTWVVIGVILIWGSFG
jgi:hypothetical protein